MLEDEYKRRNYRDRGLRRAHHMMEFDREVRNKGKRRQ